MINMKMYYRKNEIIVEVYHFFEDKTALIFSPDIAGRQNGNGWEKVKLSQLIPLEYFDEHDKRFMSKTERNKIKERLTLTEALWTCSDGIAFKDFDKAILYERELIEQEKGDNDAQSRN